MRLTLAFASCALASPLFAAEPDFNRDVRPILAAKCFKCHGPDEKSRKAELHLDAPNAAGKKLVDRVHSKDPDEVMPPPSKLTFRHAGRDFRLTDVHGKVVKEVLG